MYMSTERRPRIPADVAEMIDKARDAGESYERPFEGYIRWVLEEHLEELAIRDKGTEADWLMHHVDRWDGFQGEDSVALFDAAAATVREKLVQRVEETEREIAQEEEEEQQVILREVDALYPTDADKLAYFERMAARFRMEG